MITPARFGSLSVSVDSVIQRVRQTRPTKWLLLGVPVLVGVLAIPAGGRATPVGAKDDFAGDVNGGSTITVINNSGPGSGCKLSGTSQYVEVTKLINPTGTHGHTGDSGTNAINVTIHGTTYSLSSYGSQVLLAAGSYPCGGQTETVTFVPQNCTGTVSQPCTNYSLTITYSGPTS